MEAPKTAEEIKAEWAMDSEPAAKEEDSEQHFPFVGQVGQTLINA